MSIPTQMDTLSVTAVNRSWIRYLALALGALVVLFALFYRLDQYPAPWYDEGSHLHVAKDFALNGIYSDYSSDGLRAFGPTIGVGPTVILPIALVFKIGGVSIPLARLVIVAYAILALIAFYLLVSRFLGFWGTYIVMLVVLVSPGIDFLYHARTVLGEVPGLFFLATGLWLWLRPGKLGIPRLVLVGIFMGLASITKNQFALVILPALLLNWFADLFWYKKRGWLYFVIPGVVAGIMFFVWLYIVIIKLGQGSNFAENLAGLREASQGAFIVLSKTSLQDAVHLLVDSSVYSALFIPAFLYGLFLSLRRDEEGQKNGMVMMFILMGTLLFVASLAWPRYAFGTLILTSIFAVKLVTDLASGFKFDWASFKASLKDKKPAMSVMVLGLVIGWGLISIILPAYTQFDKVLHTGNDYAYQLASWLNANVPKDALIETWEPELGDLTDHNYHFPPQIILAKAVAEEWQNGPAASGFYNFHDYVDPDYVILGTFDKYAHLYLANELTNYVKVESIGDYDVLKRKDAASS